MDYQSFIYISTEDAAKIKKYLTEEPTSKENCFGEDCTYTKTAVFPNGVEMDIKLCGVQFQENKSNLPWTEAVLFNKSGREITHSDICDEFTGTWTLETNKNTYTVDVIAIETRANELYQAQEKLKNTPLYPHSAAYASEHGEMAQYNASFQASHACMEAIEQAISRHYSNNRLDAEAAVNDVLEQFGPDRVQYVLANTVRHKEWDGRISRDNKAWASTMPLPEGSPQDRHSEYLVVDRCNPGLIDLFLKQVRQLVGEREKPSVREKLQKAPAAPRRSAPARKKEAER